jgi:flagellum-specific peptidoglycan hydrolase FlgJ
MAYIFGGNTGVKSPEELQRRRDILAAMAARRGAPRNVGEGLTAIGQALAYRMAQGQAAKADASGRAGASDLFNSIFSGGGAEPSVSGGVPDDATADPVQSRIDQGFAPFETSATTPTPTKLSGDKQEFINSLMPEAQRVGAEIGVDPRIIVAQAAQETGWGKSAPGNNFFGIKSHGKGGGQNLTTHEVIDGKRIKINDSFRTYGSPAESVRGYADFLTSNPRYKPMLEAEDFDSQIAALGVSGYATDPNYARSVRSIALGIPNNSQVAFSGAGLPRPDTTGFPAPEQVQPLDSVSANIAGGRAPLAAQSDTAQMPNVSLPGMAQPQQQPPGADPRAALASALLARQSPQAGQQAITQAMTPQPEPTPAPPTAQPQQVAQAAPASPQMQVDPRIIEALGNRYLTQGQRAVLEAMLKRQMQASDPVRQMELERAQLELERMRNPAPPSPVTVGQGQTLVDPRTGEIVFQGQQKAPNLPAGIQEYEYAKQQGFTGTFQDWEASKRGGTALTVDPSTGEVSFQQGGIIENQIPQTKGRTEADKKYADDYLEWTTGGFADAQKQLEQLKSVIPALTPEKGLTGPLIGTAPDWMKVWTEQGQEAIDFRERVEEVVQRNLRSVLGAQFTEKEGERLIARAFNPSLTPKRNARRVKALVDQIQAGIQAKQSAAEYFEKNGTLTGWKGKLIQSVDDFDLDGDPQENQGVVDFQEYFK